MRFYFVLDMIYKLYVQYCMFTYQVLFGQYELPSAGKSGSRHPGVGDGVS